LISKMYAENDICSLFHLYLLIHLSKNHELVLLENRVSNLSTGKNNLSKQL